MGWGPRLSSMQRLWELLAATIALGNGASLVHDFLSTALR